jgi:hypothetical protein
MVKLVDMLLLGCNANASQFEERETVQIVH